MDKTACFFTKNNKISSLSLENSLLFRETHFGVKAHQNMMSSEQNKLKNIIVFEQYHPLTLEGLRYFSKKTTYRWGGCYTNFIS